MRAIEQSNFPEKQKSREARRLNLTENMQTLSTQPIYQTWSIQPFPRTCPCAPRPLDFPTECIESAPSNPKAGRNNDDEAGRKRAITTHSPNLAPDRCCSCELPCYTPPISLIRKRPIFGTLEAVSHAAIHNSNRMTCRIGNGSEGG